jgi:hypothetical protein
MLSSPLTWPWRALWQRCHGQRASPCLCGTVEGLTRFDYEGVALESLELGGLSLCPDGASDGAEGQVTRPVEAQHQHNDRGVASGGLGSSRTCAT